MQKVTFSYNNAKVIGFLLATFDIVYEKKIILFKKSFSSRHYCLVFIPWKHNEKEIVLLETDELIFYEPFDEGVVSIDEFVSPFTLDSPYYTELKIKSFIGYKFIYDSKDFISNVNNQCFSAPLTTLYQNLPNLLNEEFDEA